MLRALESEADRIDRWGADLAHVVDRGGRLLVAGTGGSPAEAQHLTAELVGRFGGERRPLSAIALHAETSAVTATAHDDGVEEVFARQVEAHGRPGDVLLLVSTSGRSANLLHAADRARRIGMTVWALTSAARTRCGPRRTTPWACRARARRPSRRGTSWRCTRSAWRSRRTCPHRWESRREATARAGPGRGGNGTPGGDLVRSWGGKVVLLP